MYLNKVTLTGYLGSDAETRTTKTDAKFVVLSLATKQSWKDRESGEWASRTDWHRAIIFGTLAPFASEFVKAIKSRFRVDCRPANTRSPAKAKFPRRNSA